MTKLWFVILVAILLFSVSCSEPYHPKTYKLRALDLNEHTNLQGSWFLGMGSIGTQQDVKYYFYYEDDYGVIKLTIEYYDMVSIVEDGAKIAICKDGYSWELHIPPGSILENYNVGLDKLK